MAHDDKFFYNKQIEIAHEYDKNLLHTWNTWVVYNKDWIDRSKKEKRKSDTLPWLISVLGDPKVGRQTFDLTEES